MLPVCALDVNEGRRGEFVGSAVRLAVEVQRDVVDDAKHGPVVAVDHRAEWGRSVKIFDHERINPPCNCVTGITYAQNVYSSASFKPSIGPQANATGRRYGAALVWWGGADSLLRLMARRTHRRKCALGSPGIAMNLEECTMRAAFSVGQNSWIWL